MLKRYCVIVAMMAIFITSFAACSKKPVGTFQSVECNTICDDFGYCKQTCVKASGNYYKR